MKNLNQFPLLLFCLIMFTSIVAIGQDDDMPFEVVGVPEMPPSGRFGGGLEGGQAPLGYVEIHGVSAGEFNPSYWEENRLHWVPEERFPLLAPRRGGVFRNIYAPSAVELEDGWRLFYGAWDGIDSGTDRLYSVSTEDFIDFYDRQTVISNGDFTHVCNVNVQRMKDGTFHMYATAAPDSERSNGIVYFHSPDGEIWNGSTQPHSATFKDEVELVGYKDDERRNLNGANVLLHDDEKFRLYFTNWRDRGKMHWAEGDDPSKMTYGGVALETRLAVNDVKKFTVGGQSWYVAAFHRKGDASLDQQDVNRLFYSLSTNGIDFDEVNFMVGAREELDRNIFAVGFVANDERILGVLYGAGPSYRSNRNQIFAHWLQKRVVLTANAAGRFAEFEVESALGPDRQLFKLPPVLPPLSNEPVNVNFEGNLTVYAEDGVTQLGSQEVSLRPGTVYRIVWK